MNAGTQAHADVVGPRSLSGRLLGLVNRKNNAFPSIEAHLSGCFGPNSRHNECTTPVDVTGGGRSSAIIRRMSAKMHGMATSAIWKAM